MQVKTFKQVEQIIEVELPMYVEYGGEFAKIISENETVGVLKNATSLRTWLISESFIKNGTPITADVFNNAFQKALSKFNAISKDLSPYDNWQKEKYGNVLSVAGSPLPENEEEEMMMMSQREQDHYVSIHENLNDQQ